MVTLVFLDKQLVFDELLLNDIPYFDNIFNGDFKESSENVINIDYQSDEFLSFLSYKFLFKSNNKNNKRKVLELCDYYGMDDLKDEYLEFHGLDYLYKNEIMEKEEYIFELIMRENNEIYFDNEEHFNKFLNDPLNNKYYNNPIDKNNILFYLVFKEYDLIDKAIDYGLFDVIDYDTKITFHHELESKKLGYNNYDDDKYYFKDINIFYFACLFPDVFSSNEIVKVLMEKLEINIDCESDFMKHIFINLYKKYSNISVIKMLSKYLDDKNDNGIQIFLTNSIYCYDKHNRYNSNSLECIETMLNCSNVDINIIDQKINPLILACKSTNGRPIKLIMNHPKFDIDKHRKIDNFMDIIISAIHDNENYDNIIKQLLENSQVDNLFEYFNYKNPLQICFEERDKLINWYFEECPGIFEELHQHVGSDRYERYKEEYKISKSKYQTQINRYEKLFNSYLKHLKHRINQFDENNNHIVSNLLSMRYHELKCDHNYNDEYYINTYLDSIENMIDSMLSSPYLDFDKKSS
jgi:hypothetical protein